MKILYPGKLRLEKFTDYAPEQYIAYVGPKVVGYLRLRQHVFTVDSYPEDVRLLQAQTCGEGSFEEFERETFLEEAKVVLSTYLQSGKRPRSLARVLCETCGSCDVYYSLQTIPLSSGGEVPNVLCGVCPCGKSFSIPHSQSVKIKKALHENKS